MTGATALHSFGLSFVPPDPFLQKLEDRFPGIRFVVPDDADDVTWCRDIDALYAWGLTDEIVHAAPALKWVQWVGAGVDRAPLALLAERDIILTNNRGVHAPNIAEHLMSLILAFTRQLPSLFREQMQHEWNTDYGSRGNIAELQGSELLILGAGQIGKALAARASAFGVEVTIVGRASRPDDGVRGIDELDALLPLADHVAICLPLTVETAGLFDDARIARMKPGACIYNIGRGAIIDTTAMVDALRSGHLGGAGLDVTDPEPLPADHPLWDLSNVIITAHTAGVTPRYWDRAFAILEDNIERFQSGAPLRNVVRFDLGY